jgi:hypothetical protein
VPVSRKPRFGGAFLFFARGCPCKFSRNSMAAAETAGSDRSHVRAGTHGSGFGEMPLRFPGSGLSLLACVALSLGMQGVSAREIGVQEAVAQAQREADGKVLAVQTLNVGKRKVYRIKVLTRDGQVRVVQVLADQ